MILQTTALQHAAWCDLERPAKAQEEAPDGHPTCVGRLFEVVDSDHGIDIGGYWTQTERRRVLPGHRPMRNAIPVPAGSQGGPRDPVGSGHRAW